MAFQIYSITRLTYDLYIFLTINTGRIEDACVNAHSPVFSRFDHWLHCPEQGINIFLV
jgi:hypothetical protein